jgi:hypothetical protein
MGLTCAGGGDGGEEGGGENEGGEKLVVVAVVEFVDNTAVLMLHTTVVCTLHMHRSPW